MTPAHVAHGTHGATADVAGWLLVALLVGVVTGAYAGAVVRRERRLRRRWPPGRTACFLTGTLLLGLALSPAVDSAAHADPRWHMVQHLAVGMLAPVGLVLGAPVTLLLGVAGRRVRRLVAGVLGSRPVHLASLPVVAAAWSGAGLYALYLTPLYGWTTGSTPLHHAVHVHLLLAGCLLTWSLVGPDPARSRPGMAHRLVALVLAAATHAHLAKLVHARAADGVTPAAGQDPVAWQQAAQLMYYGGDLVEVLLLVLLLTAWYRHGRAPGAARPRPVGRPGSAGTRPAVTGQSRP